MYKSPYNLLKAKVRVWKLLVKCKESSEKLSSLSLHCCKSVIQRGTYTLTVPLVPATSFKGRNVEVVGR